MKQDEHCVLIFHLFTLIIFRLSILQLDIIRIIKMFTILILIFNFIYFLSVCMYKNHVCVCGYVHMRRYLHLCISVETRGEPWLSSSITLHLIFDARSLPESGTCEFLFQLGWKPAISNHLSVSAHQVLGLQACA